MIDVSWFISLPFSQTSTPLSWVLLSWKHVDKIRNHYKGSKIRIFDLEPNALLPNDKIRNHYKGSKIRITLSIEYLKTRTLFEIRITPQARSIISSLNGYCWSNISMQEHLLEIRITPQASLIMSSLNDSTCNLNYIEFQRNFAIG